MHKKLNIILIILLILTIGFTYIWCAPATGQLGALTDFLHDLAMNNHDIYEVKTVQFNGVYAIGNSKQNNTTNIIFIFLSIESPTLQITKGTILFAPSIIKC